MPRPSKTLTFVQDDGRLDARVVGIGEAPGYEENQQGVPFVGKSGGKLYYWMRQAGLQRSDIYLTNVYPYQPPGNDISLISYEELAPWLDDLHKRIAALTDPYVLVPMGNTALEALTGKRNITKHRGSIYEYVDLRGRRVKVIPTLHPAATFREPEVDFEWWDEAPTKGKWMDRACQADWRRIAEDARFRELMLPQREHYIKPSLADVEQFAADVEKHADALSIDIETPRKVWMDLVGHTKAGKAKYRKRVGEAYLACVGLGFDPEFTITVPTTLEYWGSEQALAKVMVLLDRLFKLPVPKVLQNGLFDTYYLAHYGFELVNYWWDTLAMHHCMDASDRHDLAYMASIDTRQPYWKDEAKDPDEVMKYANNDEALWTYNGIDVAVTLELAAAYYERLYERKLTGFYERHYRGLFVPLLSLMRGGIGVDAARRVERLSGLERDCAAIRSRLEAMAGEPLHGPKDLSSAKIQHFLYTTLGLPAQRKRGTDRTTADEVTLRRLRLNLEKPTMRRVSEETRLVAADAIDLILQHRRKAKLASFMSEKVADDDGYVRCQYGFNTDSGRLTSRKNPRRTGMNLFNVDREARDIFIPDPGHILLELDASQLESRIVYVLTGDPELVAKAFAKSWEYDDHKWHASVILDIPESEVDKLGRYLGKTTNHAFNYGMGPKRLSERMLLDGVVRTVEECEVYLQRLRDRKRPVIEWQERTRQEVMRFRKLTNSFGRSLYFTFDRLVDETYRRGYAFRPQSDGADLVKHHGLIPVFDYLVELNVGARVVTSVYDSLLISTPPQHAWEIYEFGREHMQEPHDYYGTVMSVPAECKVGLAWGGKHTTEFKLPPSRDEFEGAIDALLREAA